MKILIISDTHRNNIPFLKLLETTGKPDILVHCGDVSGSEYLYKNATDGKVVMVSGNNDFYTELNSEEEFDIGKYHVLVTHGHMKGVSYGTERLKEYAASKGADIVMYGHTHVPSVEYDTDRKIWAVNPGSLSYPRQEGHRPSYIMMDIDGDGEARFTVNFI